MTKGFVFDPVLGRFSIVNGDRVVTTTNGTLLCFLPDSEDFVDTIAVVFPDFTTALVYNHWWISDHNGSGEYGMDEGCVTQVTVPPQEWSDTTILSAAPAGADIFASMVRINRTADPSTWGGGAIDVLPKEDVWIPFNGSVLCEAELGMSRAFSIYIEDGNLVLHRQQSIGAAPGGYGAYGSSSPGPLVDNTGGSNTAIGSAGLPVYTIQSRSVAGYIEDPVIGGPDKPVANAYGGSQACSLTDPTNYQSTYSVEITGKFGRRS